MSSTRCNWESSSHEHHCGPGHLMSRRHKRSSLLRSSTDTGNTLPEYSNPTAPNAGWTTERHSIDSDLPTDQPPEYYPESADEADEDTDDSDLLSSSPNRLAKRVARPPRVGHKRHQSDLDTLLQRSIDALEISNSLLQSSMSTTTPTTTTSCLEPSNRLSTASFDDSASIYRSSLPPIVRNIDSSASSQAAWMDSLQALSSQVDQMFGTEPVPNGRERRNTDSVISQSLPSTSTMTHYRRLSVDDSLSTDRRTRQNHLSLAPPARTDLVARAPKALTIYVNSDDMDNEVFLPSTLGIRSANAAARDWSSPGPSTMYTSRVGSSSTSSLVSPGIAGSAPSAYSLLSNIARSNTPPVSPPIPHKSPFSYIGRRGSTSSTSNSTERTVISPSLSRKSSSPDRRYASSSSRKASPGRPMTPPIEELSTSSASEDRHPTGYRTVQSLKKILSDQPPPAPKPRPQFLITPAVEAVADTSLATAHVSKLFTKNSHRSAATPRSALKKPEQQAPPTPLSLASPLPSEPVEGPSRGHSHSSLTDYFGIGAVTRMISSKPSSGMSTPKRISFAALPESYADSRPEGSVKFKTKKDRAQRKAAARAAATKAGKARASQSSGSKANAEEEEGFAKGWWSGWLLAANNGASSPGMGMRMSRHEDLVDDRNKSWNTRNYGHFEEWAV